MRMISGGKWAPLKLIAIVALPLFVLDHLGGRSYPKCVPNENLRQNRLAGAASHHHGGLSGPECPLRRGHPSGGPPGRAGGRPVSSGQKPARGCRGLSARSASRTPRCRCPHRAGADGDGWPSVPSPDVSGTTPVLPGLAAAAGGRPTAVARRLGHDL